GADRVARGGYRNDAGTVSNELLVLVGRQLPGGWVKLGPPHRRAGPRGGLQPRPDVRVVVEPGDDHLIARRPIRGEGTRDQIGQRGRARPEDHAVGYAADEVGHRGAGRRGDLERSAAGLEGRRLVPHRAPGHARDRPGGLDRDETTRRTVEVD